MNTQWVQVYKNIPPFSVHWDYLFVSLGIRVCDKRDSNADTWSAVCEIKF